MQTHLLLPTVLFAAAAAAQNYYVPDPNPVGVSCNVIPFGSTTATWSNQRYQTKVTAADLMNMPNLITGLGFAPCGSGVHHFDTIEIVMDHHPAGTSLDPTFDNNLTANAVTVLAANDYTWHHYTAATWTEVGLQRYFVYNGVDDLVIQIWTTGCLSTSSGGNGYHTDSRQRLYNYNNSSSPTGTLSSAALKMEVGMIMARLSTYGVSCPGSTGTPVHSLSGSAQPNGIVNFDLTGAPPLQIAVLAFGFFDRPPFPIDLGFLGMPGCMQYTDGFAQTALVTDLAGYTTFPFPIPNTTAFHTAKFYSQFVLLDPGVNALGATTTNYGRMLIGN